jgi:hypothetical protein
MNDKMRLALLAIGLIVSLGIAASDCIKVYAKDKNGAGVSGARVYLDGAHLVGETDSNGYLLVPLDNVTWSTDNVYNVSLSKGTKIGWLNVTVPPGTCPNATIPMLY